jgi:hypothetical protein
MMSFDEANTLERAILVTRRLELEHPAPTAKGHASDAAYALEKLSEICLPESFRTQKRSDVE